jgi:rhodanese-related sulfurtransferase
VTRNVFERFGAPILMVAKFLPGLGLISAPLLGTTAIHVSAFLLWDFVGASLWAGTWLIGGAALHEQIEYALVLVWQHGGTIIDAFALICVAMLAYRWVRRLRFRRWLAHMRISPEQLYEMMKSSAPPLIFDARPSSVRANEAYRIAGAHALDLESPDPVHPELLKRPIVVYCVCPNEATAKRIVSQLHRKNIHHVRALKGGLDEWERRGYPVEPLPSGFDAVAAHNERDDGSEYTVRVSLPK